MATTQQRWGFGEGGCLMAAHANAELIVEKSVIDTGSTRQTRGTLRHLGSSPLRSAAFQRLPSRTSSYSFCRSNQ